MFSGNGSEEQFETNNLKEILASYSWRPYCCRSCSQLRCLYVSVAVRFPNSNSEDETDMDVPLLMSSLAVTDSGIFSTEEPPNHVLLNEYKVGQGIMPHKVWFVCARAFVSCVRVGACVCTCVCAPNRVRLNQHRHHGVSI